MKEFSKKSLAMLFAFIIFVGCSVVDKDAAIDPAWADIASNNSYFDGRNYFNDDASIFTITDGSESYTFKHVESTPTSAAYTSNIFGFNFTYSFSGVDEKGGTVAGNTISGQFTWDKQPMTFFDYIAEQSGSNVWELDYVDTDVYCSFIGGYLSEFNDYKEVDGTTYTYDGDKTITIGNTDYTYVEVDPITVEFGETLNNEPSPSTYLVANFVDTSDYYTMVQVLVDPESGAVMVIKPRTYIEYFIYGKTYGGEYVFSSARYGTIRINGLDYAYVRYGVFTESGGEGTFNRNSQNYLIATIDPLGNIYFELVLED